MEFSWDQIAHVVVYDIKLHATILLSATGGLIDLLCLVTLVTYNFLALRNG